MTGVQTCALPILIVKWPGRIGPQTKSDEFVIIEDFFPSIIEMAQVENYTTLQPIDGKSFVKLLTEDGAKASPRNLYWNFPNLWGNTGPGIGPTCTIRSQNWKLIYYYETGEKELFNIAEDIGESKNIAMQNPSITKKLSQELGNYLREVDAQRPSFKATGEVCPWPDEI